MKQNKFWLKLIGTTLLLHVALILLSIIEVTIYSYLIVPGKDEKFYSQHATVSGPWISATFGSLFMFLLVKRYVKRFTTQQLTYAIGLWAIYEAIDWILILGAGYAFKEFPWELVWAAIPKIAAALLAYNIYRNKGDGQS